MILDDVFTGSPKARADVEYFLASEGVTAPEMWLQLLGSEKEVRMPAVGSHRLQDDCSSRGCYGPLRAQMELDTLRELRSRANLSMAQLCTLHKELVKPPEDYESQQHGAMYDRDECAPRAPKPLRPLPHISRRAC